MASKKSIRRPRLPANPRLGLYLRDLRESRRLNQTALARRAGCNHSWISQLEAGSHARIRIDLLRSICRQGLRVSGLQWLYIKLLWLEWQTGEPVSLPELLAQAERLLELTLPKSARLKT